MSIPQIFSAILVVLGLCTSFGATLVPNFVSEESYWTEEQGVEQGQSAARLHQVVFDTAKVRANKKATEEEKNHAAQTLAAAKARFESSKAALDNAKFWRETVPKVMRWSGAGVAVLGVLGLLVFQPKDR